MEIITPYVRVVGSVGPAMLVVCCSPLPSLTPAVAADTETRTHGDMGYIRHTLVILSCQK